MAEPKKLGPVIYNAKGEDTGERLSNDSLFVQSLRQGASAFGEIPTILPTLYGLAGAAYDYGTSGSGKTFGDNLYTPEGHEKVKELDQRIFNQLKERNPDEDDEKLNKRLDFIRKHSSKYYDETTPYYRRGISFGRGWNRGVQEAVGEERLPSERTQTDALIGNLATAAVPLPLPAGARGSINTLMTTPATSNLARAGKIAGNVAELTTPFTAPFTAKRYGLNVGVAETMDQGMRFATSQPNVTDYVKNDDGSYSAKAMAASGAAAAAAAFAVWKGKNIASIVPGTTYGPSRAQTMGENLPIPGGDTAYYLKQGVRNIGSETGAPKQMLKDLGVPDDIRARADVRMDQETGAMSLQHAENYAVRGIFRDGTEAKYKLVDTAKLVDELTPDDLQLYKDSFVARNRIHDAIEGVRATNTKVGEAQNRLAREMAKTTPDPARLRAIYDELTNFKRELHARVNDTDPNLRPHSSTMSDRDAVAINVRAKNNPKVNELLTRFRQHHDDMALERYKAGVISKAAYIKERTHFRLGLTHHEENPLGGMSIVERKLAWAKNQWAPDQLNEMGRGRGILFRGATEREYRRGYMSDLYNKDNKAYELPRIPHQTGPAEARVNAPFEPMQQMLINLIRSQQSISGNTATREWAHVALASPKNINGKYIKEVNRIPSHQIGVKANEIDKELAKAAKHNSRTGYYENGDFVIVQHGSPLVKQSFEFAPAAVVPILNEARKFSQAWVTGPIVKPFFALTSQPWDATAMAFFRNPSIAGGPFSAAMMKAGIAMGMKKENPIIQFLANSVAGGDFLINNAVRLPATFIKRVAIHMAGEASVAAAKNIEQSLIRNSSTMAIWANNAGLRPLVSQTAKILADSLQASHMYQMAHMRIGQTNILSDVKGYERELTKMGKNMLPQEQSWIAKYKNLFAMIHDTAKEMSFSTNKKLYEYELKKAYKSIPKETREAIANEVRTIGGDYQRHSGVQWVNRALSTTMFGNVALQGSRWVVGKMHKNPIATSYRLMMGAILPAIYGLHSITTSSPEAAHWLWNVETDERRLTGFYFWNPVVAVRRAMGHTEPFDKSQIWRISQSPELFAFTIPVLNGLLALGWLKHVGLPTEEVSRGRIVPPNTSRDMHAVIDGIFGQSLPPLNLFGGLSGHEVKPSHLLYGESPLRKMPENRMSGANSDMMSPGSSISRTFYDTIGALYGVTAQHAVSAVNVGLETIQRPKGGVVKGTGDALEHFITQEKASMTHSNMLFPDVARNFIFTPVAKELGKQMQTLAQINKQYSNQDAMRRRGNTVDRLRNQPGVSVGEELDDPMLANIVGEIHTRLFSGQMNGVTKERIDARALHEAAQVGSAPDKTPKERHMQAQQTALKVNKLDNMRYTIYQQVMGDLENRFGKQFLQKYGAKFSPEALLAATKLSARRATLQAPQRVPLTLPGM